MIELCSDIDAPKLMPFSFVGIEKLEDRINKNCDVIGVVQEVSSKTEIELKNGKGRCASERVVL